MQYCSVAFLGVFLPLTLLFYGIVPKRKRWLVLLIASYIFFWSLSGKLLIYLLFSTFSIHHFGLWLDKVFRERDGLLENCDKENKKSIKKLYENKCKRILFLACLIHIGVLLYLKYSVFLGSNINSLFELLGISFRFKIHKLLIPIGISFYTLQGLSYIIDVYKGKTQADSNMGRLALFMAFFPCIMEGPICRYSDTAINLYEGKLLEYKNITFGLQRILWGMMKKMVVADRINPFVKSIFLGYEKFDGFIILMGAILYTVQLYMDFSGTMDMVIGISEMFGIRLPENFRQPFFSKNISDFWSRWHITLGTWFKDYIFYPVSLSKHLKKVTLVSRKYLGKHAGALFSGSIALFFVWICNGLWHGAAWTYIFFGLYHFFLIVLGNIFTPLVIKICKILKINRKNFAYQGLQICKTCVLIVFGELIFRAYTLESAFLCIKKIFCDFTFLGVKNGTLFNLGLDRHDFFIIILISLVVFISSVLKERGVNIRESVASKNVFVRWSLYYLLILIIIIFGAYGVGYKPVDPLYANF